MNQTAKNLLDNIRRRIANPPGYWSADEDLFDECASILQAVFDPENQPSQFGTVLFSKDIPGSGPPS